ncbi:MAG: hypothetical protein ACEPOV_11390 [Hyphomicrobiales bacterium]
MIRTLNSILFFVFIICISSCSDLGKTEQTEANDSMGNQKYKFVIYDSIDLTEVKKFKVTDYNEHLKSFIGLFDKDIIGFSKHGTQFRIAKYGEGPEDYTYRRPYHSNVKYLDDSTVMINSYNYLKYYSIEGEFIDKAKVDDEVFYLDRKILAYNSDNNCLIFDGDNSKVIDLEIDLEKMKLPYDGCHFFLLNKKDLSSNSYAPIEKDNRIMKENRSFWGYDPKVAYNKATNEVAILHSADHKLYVYNVNRPKEYKTIELTPDNYPEVLLYQDYKATPEEQKAERIKDILSSHYKKLYYSQDTIITVYRPGVEKSIVDKYGESLFDYKEFSLFALDNYKNIIEYYIKGEKVSHDIKIPDSYEVTYIANSKNIICENKNQELVKNGKAIQRLYIGGLERE